MKQVFLLATFGVLLLVYLVSCEEDTKPTSKPTPPPILSVDGEMPSRKVLEQNWTMEDRENFWFTSQGSRILPYVWFTYLEQVGNEKLFRNAAHMSAFGYLPEKSSKLNPSGLPIGFAITKAKHYKDAHLGFTCAACHTNQINYKGNHLLIEGAPTLANFRGFFSQLIQAMRATHDDDAKFERFAQNVLGDQYSDGKAKKLREQLDERTQELNTRQAVNALPADYPADFTSYGRLDAFGQIENAGAAFALGNIKNGNAPTAPVSYPFLWGTHQSDVVQWNASANNRIPVVGPLSRNIGEVVGVFGGLEIRPKKAGGTIKNKYTSTANFHGVGVLEGYIKKLRSPSWPEDVLPALDMEKVARGAVLFEAQCASCHQVIAREDEGLNYTANQTLVSELGTDRETAWQIANHTSKTLQLEGVKTSILTGDKFGPTAPSIQISVNGVVGLILEHPLKALQAAHATSKIGGHTDDKGLETTSAESDISQFMADAEAHTNTPYHDIEADDLSDELNNRAQSLLAQHLEASNQMGVEMESYKAADLVYKGRPLNGIWATAPYLHNGSVPNLWELMKSPAERVTSFWVGSHEFDPENVGFITDRGKSEFKVLKAGTTEHMPGNSNAGHTYGTDLTDDEKWDLIEYMKSL